MWHNGRFNLPFLFTNLQTGKHSVRKNASLYMYKPGCQECWSKIVHWPIYCTCKLPTHADCWDASYSIYSTGRPRGFACDVLHEFFSNISHKAHCVKCMSVEVMNSRISIHTQRESRAATRHCHAAAPSGNKRAVAPIHVSTVTRMEWQGIAAATSATSSLHSHASAVAHQAEKKPCSFEGCCYSGRLVVLHGHEYAQRQ